MNARHNNKVNWWTLKKQLRGARALTRQLAYQEEKAIDLEGKKHETLLNIFIRARAVREKLERIRPLTDDMLVLEVGSGAHGLVFAFGTGFAVGIDPLAASYKKLFAGWQGNAQTAAAIGEQLPFENNQFDVMLSDNVVDHAADPVGVIQDAVRVLKTGGLFYFTVNIHHAFYDWASRAHGVWNALGINFEISPLADHTIHFTERQISTVIRSLPLKVVEMNSTIDAVKADYRKIKAQNMEQRFKKIFFKNALFEVVAIKE
jgi:SAM-dependent methyltransferase